MARLHAGQAEIKPLRAEGETLVINAKQVHDRGVQITNMNRIFSDSVAEIIRGSIGHARIANLVPIVFSF